jgi:hypothetical protein
MLDSDCGGDIGLLWIVSMISLAQSLIWWWPV